MHEVNPFEATERCIVKILYWKIFSMLKLTPYFQLCLILVHFEKMTLISVILKNFIWNSRALVMSPGTREHLGALNIRAARARPVFLWGGTPGLLTVINEYRPAALHEIWRGPGGVCCQGLARFHVEHRRTTCFLSLRRPELAGVVRRALRSLCSLWWSARQRPTLIMNECRCGGGTDGRTDKWS